jgi:hypothetical protein
VAKAVGLAQGGGANEVVTATIGASDDAVVTCDGRVDSSAARLLVGAGAGTPCSGAPGAGVHARSAAPVQLVVRPASEESARDSEIRIGALCNGGCDHRAGDGITLDTATRRPTLPAWGAPGSG